MRACEAAAPPGSSAPPPRQLQVFNSMSPARFLTLREATQPQASGRRVWTSLGVTPLTAWPVPRPARRTASWRLVSLGLTERRQVAGSLTAAWECGREWIPMCW